MVRLRQSIHGSCLAIQGMPRIRSYRSFMSKTMNGSTELKCCPELNCCLGVVMFQGLLYLTPLLARLDVALHNFVESAENKLYGQIPHYGESGSHLARPSLAA
ncbi:hypothetical protein PR003_g13468 [Phytophthora rubi]|uniref:Uncharacterized protein n=1 Tax=Phytophthora rubi TaxID=129364 RepID=A0A6A4FH97_9STRA|nr:hypothetical protein PR003_g13468 [Phytophthora rubi]